MLKLWYTKVLWSIASNSSIKVGELVTFLIPSPQCHCLLNKNGTWTAHLYKNGILGASYYAVIVS